MKDQSQWIAILMTKIDKADLEKVDEYMDYTDKGYLVMLRHLGANKTLFDRVVANHQGVTEDAKAFRSHLHFAYLSHQMTLNGLETSGVPDKVTKLQEGDIEQWNHIYYKILKTRKQGIESWQEISKWLDTNGYVDTPKSKRSAQPTRKSSLTPPDDTEINFPDIAKQLLTNMHEGSISAMYFESRKDLVRKLDIVWSRVHERPEPEAKDLCKQLCEFVTLLKDLPVQPTEKETATLMSLAENIEGQAQKFFPFDKMDQKIILATSLALLALCLVGVALMILAGPVGWVGNVALVFVLVGLGGAYGTVSFDTAIMRERDFLPEVVSQTNAFCSFFKAPVAETITSAPAVPATA